MTNKSVTFVDNNNVTTIENKFKKYNLETAVFISKLKNFNKKIIVMIK